MSPWMNIYADDRQMQYMRAIQIHVVSGQSNQTLSSRVLSSILFHTDTINYQSPPSSQPPLSLTPELDSFVLALAFRPPSVLYISLISFLLGFAAICCPHNSSFISRGVWYPELFVGDVYPEPREKGVDIGDFSRADLRWTTRLTISTSVNVLPQTCEAITELTQFCLDSRFVHFPGGKLSS